MVDLHGVVILHRGDRVEKRRQQIRTADAESQSVLQQMLQELSAAKSRAAGG